MDKASHFVFFADDLSDDTVTLDPGESRHAIAVLRLRPGDELLLTNGKGCLATAEFLSGNARRLIVGITSRSNQTPPSPEIHLCTGLPDREAFESILTNATALSIASIIPVVAQYCQKKWWDSWSKQKDRFCQKMITALKQSHNVHLPELSPPCTMDEAIAKSANTTLLIADPSGDPFHEVPVADDKPITCFIGPPGGFSDTELQLLTGHSGQLVTIAHTRLRTELAATVLCAQVLGGQL